MTTIQQNQRDSIYGFIVGDCLGVPYEFSPFNNLKSLKMIGHGTHDQLPGTWSDDTSFLLATLDSDLTDTKELKDNFKKIILDHKYTSRGYLFDIGAATHSNLMGDKINTKQEGNGSLMRILPYGFLDMHLKKRDFYVNASSYITHKSILSSFCCFAYQELIRYSLLGEFNYVDICSDLFPKDIDGINLNLTNPSTNGYVLDSLAIVVNIASKATSYKDGIIQAINLGGDTDTHAALVGALLAIRFKDFKKYIKEVHNIEYAVKIMNNFFKRYKTDLINE